MKFNTKPTEERMQKSIDVYEANLSTIRAGRANPNALSKITVPSEYRAKVTLNMTPSSVWPVFRFMCCRR